MLNNKYIGELTIYCHDELVKMITTFCELTLPQNLLQFIGKRILIREVVDGEHIQVIGMDIQIFDTGNAITRENTVAIGNGCTWWFFGIIVHVEHL